MELEYYGANCFKIAGKKATLVVDDNLAELGLSSVIKKDDIALFTQPPQALPKAAGFVIAQPGEYEVSGVSIQGIAAQAHTDEAGKQSATIFKFEVGDIRLVALGHIYPALNDAQLEAIGTVDVLLVPVGGSGYTLDPVGALELIRKIEPKVVVPSHYADSKVKYPVPQQSLEEALKGLAMEPKERLAKLKLKPADLIGEGVQLIVLDRQ